MFGPGIRGGEKQKTSRPNQLGKNFLQEFLGIFHPIQQVGAEYKIKRSERREPQRIPSPKTNSFGDFFGGSHGSGGLGQAAFLLEAKSEDAPRGQPLGRRDEGF